MVKSKQKDLVKGVFIYAIGTFGTKLLSFIIVPMYTYYIVTEDLGIYDLLMATVSLLSPLITLQISDAAYKWILQEERVKDHIRATIQVLFINCFLAFFLVLLINVFKEIPYCLYFAIILVLSRMYETLQKLLRGLKRQKLIVVVGIIHAIILLLSNVIQIVFLGTGIVGLFNSIIVSNFISIIIIFITEKRLRLNVFCGIDIVLIKKMLGFSVPLIPNYMNWWVINSSDKYIVNIFLGNAANGVLAIAHKFPTILQTVLGLFNKSWQDVSISEKEANYSDNSLIFKRLYQFSFGLLFLLIPATKIFIVWVMSNDYKSACDYVAFYYIGIVFQAFSSFFGVGYLRNNKTKGAFSTSVYGAVVNALCNIAMIRFIGMQAAAISTFLGFLVMWLVRVKQNKDELGISIKWFEIILLTLTCVAFAIFNIFLSVHWNFLLFAIGCILFVSLNKKLLYHLLLSFRMKFKKITKMSSP